MGLATHYVNSVKELHTLQGTPEMCTIAGGFWKAGDGGGGTFIWVPTAAKAEEDDDCIVIRFRPNAELGHWLRLLSGNEVNVRWFGARPIHEAEKTDETPKGVVTDCTRNFKKATAYLLRHGGGVMRIPAGTWRGRLDWSASDQGDAVKRLILAGEGEATTVQYDQEAILDLASRTGVTVRDIRFEALPGAKACILACRLQKRPEADGTRKDTPLKGTGAFHRLERVTFIGEPSVAGLYSVGAEVSECVQCSFKTLGVAPGAFFGGANDLNYDRPHPSYEILSPVSMTLTRCTICSFIKASTSVTESGLSDPGERLEKVKGPPVLIGSDVSGVVFEQCYFHVAEPGRGCVEIGKPDGKGFKNINTLSFLSCHFESQNNREKTTAKNNAHGILCNGRGQIQYLTVESCFFSQRREEHGYYCIYAPDAMLTAARIDGNKDTQGAGLKIGVLTVSTVVWDGTATSLESIVKSPTAKATLVDPLRINVGDDILVGNNYQPNGTPTGSAPELVTVKTKEKNEITVSPPFSNDHVYLPTATRSIYVRFGRIELGRAANNRIESFAPPLIKATSGSTGNLFVARGEFL